MRIGIEPRNGDVFDPAVLAVIEQISAAAWEVPHSDRVESLTNFQYTRNLDGEIEAGDLFNSNELISPAERQQRREFALSDPNVVNLSVNPEGTMAGVQVIITLPEDDPRATTRITEYSRDLLAQFAERHPDINFYLTGSIVTNDAFFKAATLDTAKLIGIMLLLAAVLLALLLRSVSVVFIELLLIVGSIVIGLGIASWFRLPFTVFSSAALIITIAVVTASSVHILLQFLAEYRGGAAKLDALRSALTLNWRPVALTSITTAVGFLCLNFSEIPPSRFLGTTAALAVLGSLLLNFTLLPALLRWLPVRQSGGGERSHHFWDGLANFTLNNRVLISVVVLLLSVVSISFVTRNEVHDSVLTYFDRSVPFRSDSDYLMENLFYFYSMDLSIPSGEENGINDPAYMKKVDALVAWANEQPEVYTVLSYTNILKNLNRAIHEGDENWYRLPDDKGVAAEYMMMYEMSVPFGLDLNNQLNVDRSAAKVIIGFHDVSGAQLVEFDQRLQTWINANFEPRMRSVPAGPSLMFANIWGDAAASNLQGMAIAVLVISLIIAFAMRNATLGAMSLVPNALPILIAFGLWGFFVGQIDMGASVVAIIAFGIVVDDSIHFVDKFRRGVEELGYSAAEAVRYATRTVGRAITISTVVLVAGFSVLAQSSFALNSKVGLLTCVIIVLALLLDLFLLPVLLTALYRKRRAADTGQLAEASAG